MAAVSATIVDYVKLDKRESQFLELRKPLRDHFREELRKESVSLHNSPKQEKKLPCDNYGPIFGQYGSFFSQYPQLSISQRVLESKGMLEVQQSAASISATIVDYVKLDEKESQALQLKKQLKDHFPEELRKESGSLHNSPQQEKKLPYDNYGSIFGQYGSFFCQSQLSISQRILESKEMLEFQQSAASISATIVDYVKLDEKESQFLQLKKQLKDHFPEELRKESGSLHNSPQQEKKLPYDNYGSFFGQSQLSISQRVLESKGVLEVQQSPASRLKNLTAASKAKPDMLIRRPKAYELKVSRDYSSILFDGVENLTSASGVQSTFSSSVTKKHLDETKGSCKLERKKLMPNQLHSSRDKVPDQHKIAHTKFSEACNAEVMPKLLECSTKYRTSIGQKASSSRSLIAKKRKSEERIDCVEHKKAKAMQNKQQSTLKVQASDVHKVSVPKPQSAAKQQSEQGKERHGCNRANAMPSKLQASSQHKELNETEASLSKLHFPTKQQMGQEKKLEKANKAKTLSKHQIKRPTHEPCYDDEVDMSYISSLCQSLFRRNHTKQAHDDHDLNVDCMVSSFSDILKEERKSAKFARKEDQIEQLWLKSQEREEKLRRQAKKLKLNQN